MRALVDVVVDVDALPGTGPFEQYTLDQLLDDRCEAVGGDSDSLTLVLTTIGALAEYAKVPFTTEPTAAGTETFTSWIIKKIRDETQWAAWCTLDLPAVTPRTGKIGAEATESGYVLVCENGKFILLHGVRIAALLGPIVVHRENQEQTGATSMRAKARMTALQFAAEIGRG